jgi:tetrahydromethanopterin S-methyltransferase subunit F
MSITAPPQPNQDELEALIEETRERTRRRRLRNAVAALAAAAIAVGVVSAFVVVGRGTGTDGAPEGFRLVHARGPVEHAQIEWYSTGQMAQRLVDISTGEQRRAPVVFDIWWDRGRDLFRAVARVDGRVQSDVSAGPARQASAWAPAKSACRRSRSTCAVRATRGRSTGAWPGSWAKGSFEVGT